MKLALVSTTLILVIASFSGLAAHKGDPFASIPSAKRERLKTRLAKFVECHRTKQWDKVYDFLAELDKESAVGGLPKDRFLKEKLYSTVRKFTPKSSQQTDGPDVWTIWGCATYDEGTMESAVKAYDQNDDWFFSDIWSAPRCVGCKPRGCQH